jgi:hypothetical protein
VRLMGREIRYYHFRYKGSKGNDGTKKEDGLFPVSAFQDHSGMRSGSVDVLLHKSVHLPS